MSGINGNKEVVISNKVYFLFYTYNKLCSL